MSRKRKKRRFPKPYSPIKMKLFNVTDPFGDAPVEERRRVMREVGAKAKARFQEVYPKIGSWFDEFDSLYILAFSVFYFLTAPEGVDKEAIEGKLDFGPYHLELLQAFALSKPTYPYDVLAYVPGSLSLRAGSSLSATEP